MGELDRLRLEFILGMPLRRFRAPQEVLARAGWYREVTKNLRVKEVWVEGERYILCHNREGAERDSLRRKEFVARLEQRLAEGSLKALLKSPVFRRLLQVREGRAHLDRSRVEQDARLNGKWMLRTNIALLATDVALQYKRLLLFERSFRAVKSVLETRPIYHQWNATITGHVICSFLALVLLDEMERRLAQHGWTMEWDVVRQDLETLCEVEVRDGGDWYLLRTAIQGVAGKVLQAVGVAVPPLVRPAADVVPRGPVDPDSVADSQALL